MGKKNSTKKQISKPGLITLQWLNYDFWALGLIGLTFVASLLSRYYGGYNTLFRVEETIYPIVASVILVLTAFVLDSYYSKSEVIAKNQSSSIVKIIHSVIFAIVTAVSLVAGLFAAISIILNSYPDKSLWENVTVSLTLFVGFGLLFVRTIKYDLFKQFRSIYRFFMLIIMVLGVVLSFAGPFNRAMELRKPIVIRDMLQTYSATMSDYVNSNKNLPGNLNELSSSNYFPQMMYGTNAINEILSSKLITYRPNIKPATTENNQTTYYYELCGTFEKSIDSGKMNGSSNYSSEYPTFLSLNDILAGTNCYKLSAIAMSKQI